MCNPPFYSSAKEVADLADGKELAPNAVGHVAYLPADTDGFI